LIYKLRTNIGCHFQGTSPSQTDPGLKPWAILSDHFMVKSKIFFNNGGLLIHFEDSRRR
jgi:hypothetical protein